MKHTVTECDRDVVTSNNYVCSSIGKYHLTTAKSNYLCLLGICYVGPTFSLCSSLRLHCFLKMNLVFSINLKFSLIDPLHNDI